MEGGDDVQQRCVLVLFCLERQVKPGRGGVSALDLSFGSAHSKFWVLSPESLVPKESPQRKGLFACVVQTPLTLKETMASQVEW